MTLFRSGTTANKHLFQVKKLQNAGGHRLEQHFSNVAAFI